MDPKSGWMMEGIYRATLALVLGAVLLGVRWGIDSLRRLLRRWLGATPVEVGGPGECPPAGPGAARAAWLSALILGAIPVAVGLFQLSRGRFTARVGGRSHPNPPIYLYEGAAASANAAGWILVGVAIFAAFAGWPSRRWRWPGVGLALVFFYAAFIAWAGADAHAVKVR